jgi:N-acetylglutamate synthase-like GNAT family acetyltransferase
MQLAYSSYIEEMGIRLPPLDVDYSTEIQNYPTWVVESEGEIVAGLIVVFEEEYASVANIAVRPDMQGQGLGRELLQHAETISTEKAYTEIRLATHIRLVDNISLYKHLGWIEFDRDEYRIYMKKSLKRWKPR